MRPVASTRANSVRMFTEKPNSQQAAMVPNREMGMAMAGISVSRMDPENRRIVAMTTSMAMPRVINTSLTAPRIKTALSEMTESCRSENRSLTSAMASRTPWDISMVLDPAWRTIPMPTTRSPSRRTMLVASAGEKVTVATSPTRMPSLITSASMSRSRVTAASARTSSCCSPARKLPAGTSRGAPRSTSAMSVTVRL